MSSAGELERACAVCGAPLRPGAVFCAQCGTAVPESDEPPIDPLLGSVLAQKFRLLSLLGEGGMGRVYRAEQQPLGIEVVIKALHPALCSDPMIVKRFFREAQAASRLRHPNCVSVLDFGDSNGTLFIAMELLRGRTLTTVLQQDGALDPKRAIRIVSQVLDVLEAAHRMSIVHRDLKPDNIMVEDLATQRDFVKVLDFGIAKIVEPQGATKLTQTGMIFGTPQYMAPEQATDGGVDGRSDLYAVGVVLYELLTGRVPFTSSSLAGLLADLVSKPAPPILSVRPDLSPQLAAIIDSTLAKSPASRPQQALELKLALEACIRSPTRDGDKQPCPSCGHMLPASAKFCGECGASISIATATAVGDKFADLRRFLPAGVVDEVAQLRARSAGEKRELVVAVVDVGGEASDRVLEELYGGIQSIALRRGGTFEKRTGAGAILTFGLAMLQADDAERAVAAALDARVLAAKIAPHLELTWAIHGGLAVVEPGDQRYSPVGDTVELPTRLAATLGGSKILVSERIRNAIHARVPLATVEAVRLKGRSAAVPTFEVMGLQISSDARGVLARPPTVGRSQLLDAIARVADESKRGRVIHIVGEPGAGKSRFLEELAVRWKTAIRASAHARGTRVEPVISEILTRFGAGVDGYRSLGLPAADARMLARHGEGSIAGMSEAEERMAVLGALRTGLEQLAPVALLVDDAHVAEPITAALLGRCVTEPIARVTLVTTARPGYAMAWDAARAAAAGLQAVTLPALGDDAIAELVAGALAPTTPPPQLAAAVAARAGGSPLMALEVLRALVDRGVLVSSGGRWTLAGDLAAVPRPEGLRALLAARIDALPARARDVLACAAVFGGDPTAELLQQIAAHALGGADPIDRERELLASRGLVVEDHDRIHFAEPSVREAFLERLSRDARKRLHLAVANALAAMTLPPVVEEVIGEHFAQGGDSAQALAWLARGSAAALRAGQRQRVIQILRKARELARASGRGDRKYAEDSLQLGDLLLEHGELAAARDVAGEGLSAAHADDDPELISRLRRLRGRALLAIGDVDAALADLDAALSGALGQRDRVLIAELHGDLGEAREKKGELAKALELMVSALELAQGTSSHDVRRLALRLLTGLGRVSVRTKDLDRAQRFLQQGLELAEALDDKLGAARVLGNLAGVYHARSDFMTAIRFVKRALDLSREVGDLVGTTRQLNNLGTLYAALGDVASATSSYDAALAAAQRCGWREGMAAATAGKTRLVR
jgi:tetratricopeptide (TPR) repeat protein